MWSFIEFLVLLSDYSIIRVFVYSCIREFVYSFIRLFDYSCVLDTKALLSVGELELRTK